MTGTFSWAADQIALVCYCNGPLYRIGYPLFQKLDQHLTAFVKTTAVITVRTEALRWLLENGEPLYDISKEETNAGREPEDLITPTPDEIRDWFCWLYRCFVDWKKDQNA